MMFGNGRRPRPQIDPRKRALVGSMFRARELERAEHKAWSFPFPAIENRLANEKDVALAAEDANHRLTLEVTRIYQGFVTDFVQCLRAHEKRYNHGRMPQVSIAPRQPRCAVEAVAMVMFLAMIKRTFIDVTEEVDLLHPDAGERKVYG